MTIFGVIVFWILGALMIGAGFSGDNIPLKRRIIPILLGMVSIGNALLLVWGMK